MHVQAAADTASMAAAEELQSQQRRFDGQLGELQAALNKALSQAACHKVSLLPWRNVLHQSAAACVAGRPVFQH